MQLGTRWSVGSEPPASVPAELRPEIARVEAELADGPGRASWTLTWLEGRPIAELDAGFEVLLDPEGVAFSRPFQD
ncbi:hypothetical protein QWJ90_00690 [Microbacterium oryzae]|uniref:hypothetical protein n=1 Tax=Microbacterium oryzae TaxID=743009 RepID=UPI0025B1E564|nr:hypothetical protein [Microbacterium oryzae]MDN3309445.1 hypothetical protein [Microbacterium oryzae]